MDRDSVCTVTSPLGLLSNKFLILDAELEKRLDRMERDTDEFKPDELGGGSGGLVFSEDEDDGLDPDERDDW